MDIAPLTQFQVVQHSLNNIELKLLVTCEIDSEQEQGVKEILQQHLGHPFEIDISYHAALQRSASGKFEDFVSLL